MLSARAATKAVEEVGSGAGSALGKQSRFQAYLLNSNKV